MIERIRRALDTNPWDDPDGRRKWEAARAVSDGTVEAVHVAAWLEGPRRSHSLFEGIDVDRWQWTDDADD